VWKTAIVSIAGSDGKTTECSGPDSAEGAQYESQGQARSEASASPMGSCPKNNGQGLKGRNKCRRISPFQGWLPNLIVLPGATRFALAPGYHIARLWRCLILRAFAAVSYCAPLPRSHIARPLARSHIARPLALSHIARLCRGLILRALWRCLRLRALWRCLVQAVTNSFKVVQLR
jgi:hypothetical protein